MVQKYSTIAAGLVLLLIAGCGGGGGSDASAPPAGAAAPTPPAVAADTPPAANQEPPAVPGPVTQPPAAAALAAASSSIIHEKGIGGSRIWIVNQDNDSVSVIDGASFRLIAEVAVGGNPRSLALSPDGKIWVTNRSSATISVVDGTRLALERTIALPRASQPFGIVFSPLDGSPWVVLEALGQVNRLDRISGAIVASIAVGANARHLSMPASGKQMLVSRFISPPLPGESGAAPTSRTGGTAHGGEVLVIDPVAMSVVKTIVLAVSERSDSSLGARGVPNYLGAAAVAPDGLSAWVPSKQDNVMRGALRDGLPLDFQSTVRAISSRIILGDRLVEDKALRIDHDNSGVASAAAFHPSGAYLFVALQTSRHVAVVDPTSGREMFRFVSGLAPQGLAVSDDGRRLFVDNFMERTLTVFDLTRLATDGRITLLATVPVVTAEKLTPTVLKGKQFFYDALDARLARDAYLSCASCHADAGTDGRTWDFTGFGEGLRRTVSLRGRAGGSRPLHWSGNFDETQDFEGQIRRFAGGRGLMTDADFEQRKDPLGAPKAGVSPDLDALSAYLASLDTQDPSPHRNADGSLTAQGLEGKSLFAGSGCLTCHGGEDFSGADEALHDVGTLKPSSGQRLGAQLMGIDTPTLRGAWASGTFLHDGSAASAAQAIAAHSSASSLRVEDLNRLSAYVMQIESQD